MFKFIKYLYGKYWKMRGSPIQPWMRWRFDRKTQREVMKNGWKD